MKKCDKNKVILWSRILTAFAVVCWCAFIFCMSAQNAEQSGNQSSVIVDKVVDIYSDIRDIEPDDIPPNVLSEISLLVRKSAHFFEFTLLGVLVCVLLLNFCNIGIFKRAYSTVAYACDFCFLYACSDEFHQHFIPGRSMQFTDVMIDTAGSLLGIILAVVLCRRIFLHLHSIVT